MHDQVCLPFLSNSKLRISSLFAAAFLLAASGAEAQTSFVGLPEDGPAYSVPAPDGGAADPATPDNPVQPDPVDEQTQCGKGTSRQCVRKADGSEFCSCCPGETSLACGATAGSNGRTATERCECAACMVVVRYSRTDSTNIGNGKKILSGAASEISCLQRIVHDRCRSDTQNGNMNLADDLCVGSVLRFSNNSRNYSYYDSISGQLDEIPHFGSNTQNGYVLEGVAFIDENCNPVDTNVPRALCDNASVDVQYVWSPLALFWEDGVTLNSQFSVSSFPLAPGSIGKWYAWYGSAKLPLVVYDPQRSGKITSAHQLFGPWAFGGQKSAALDSGGVPIPWRDGYHALGSLDIDKNGKVEARELDDISLWFDINQDGISQPGEVKPSAEAGIKSLFYKSDGHDPSSGNIFASTGFERRRDGRVSLGASVDWYSAAYPTKLEALRANEPRLLMPTAPDVNAPAPAKKAAPATGLSGAWHWQTDHYYAGEKQQGLLTLVQEGEKLTGHSLSEIPVADSGSKVKKIILSLPLNGAQRKDAQNRIHFRAKVRGYSGKLTVTDLYLSEDGKTIYGKSSADVGTGSGRGAAERYEYAWTATRL